MMSYYIYDQNPAATLPISEHRFLSAAADTIECDDGSLWKVNLYDERKIHEWQVNDPLSITQNARWFSSYHYRIVHRNSGETIEANLWQDPTLVQHITEYDLEQGQLTLSNQTQWKIHPEDLQQFREWDFSASIIIGDNNEYTPSSAPSWECILINTKQSTTPVRAHQFQKK